MIFETAEERWKRNQQKLAAYRKARETPLGIVVNKSKSQRARKKKLKKSEDKNKDEKKKKKSRKKSSSHNDNSSDSEEDPVTVAYFTDKEIKNISEKFSKFVSRKYDDLSGPTKERYKKYKILGKQVEQRDASKKKKKLKKIENEKSKTIGPPVVARPKTQQQHKRSASRSSNRPHTTSRSRRSQKAGWNSTTAKHLATWDNYSAEQDEHCTFTESKKFKKHMKKVNGPRPHRWSTVALDRHLHQHMMEDKRVQQLDRRARSRRLRKRKKEKEMEEAYYNPSMTPDELELIQQLSTPNSPASFRSSYSRQSSNPSRSHSRRYSKVAPSANISYDSSKPIDWAVQGSETTRVKLKNLDMEMDPETMKDMLIDLWTEMRIPIHLTRRFADINFDPSRSTPTSTILAEMNQIILCRARAIDIVHIIRVWEHLNTEAMEIKERMTSKNSRDHSNSDVEELSPNATLIFELKRKLSKAKEHAIHAKKAIQQFLEDYRPWYDVFIYKGQNMMNVFSSV
mmetsp:Transcript_6953/g.10173  ORF Transcript_6953/g.10173 Transcript_6953/m.10173 type:complete len:512 (+) Transcript_6953:65-1600(+)